MESDSVEFFEHIYPYKTRLESSNGGSRRSKRQKTSTSFGSDFVTFLLESEPQTFKEAMLYNDSTSWKETVNSEIESILRNYTLELVDLPLGNKP